MDTPWEQQRREKYRDHDLTIDEIRDLDFETIKGNAIKKFVETNQSGQARLIVHAFMEYLTGKGFRIVKKEK